MVQDRRAHNWTVLGSQVPKCLDIRQIRWGDIRAVCGEEGQEEVQERIVPSQDVLATSGGVGWSRRGAASKAGGVAGVLVFQVFADAAGVDKERPHG